MAPNVPYIYTNPGVMRFETDLSRPASLWHHGVAVIGNNQWCWSVHRLDGDPGDKPRLMMTLACNEFLRNCRVWSCDATYSFIFTNTSEPEKEVVITKRKVFDGQNQYTFLHEDVFLEDLGSQSAKLELRVEITIHETKGFRMPVLGKFDHPIEHLTDVILLVEDQKVYIGKQALATHSGFFRAMFYGNFAERSEEEVELKDLKHSEFIDLLNMIFPSHLKLNENNISHILKLADRFEVPKVMVKAEQFLIHDKKIPFKFKSKLLKSYRFPRPEDNKSGMPEPLEGLFDAYLVAGKDELDIGKQAMAMHSEYFRKIFFEDRKLENKFELEGIGSGILHDFLRLVFIPHENFTADNISGLLHLAHRFEMWKILEDGEEFLIRNQKIKTAVKLKLAQEYLFPRLQSKTIENLGCVSEILGLADDLHYKDFDVNTVKLLFKRLIEVRKEEETAEERRLQMDRAPLDQEEVED